MRSAVLAWFVLLFLLLASPVMACSWGDPARRLLDEINGYYAADVVFLARVGAIEEQPPTSIDNYWMATAHYEIMEVYRGNPEPDGMIASEVYGKAGADGAPPSSCTGGSLPSGVQGEYLLVFATKLERPGFAAYYRLDRFNTGQVSAPIHLADVLNRMRQYGKAEHVPLLPASRPITSPSN